MYKNKAAHHIERRAAFILWHPLRESNSQLTLRSMAYHVIHGSDVTSNIIPYAE